MADSVITKSIPIDLKVELDEDGIFDLVIDNDTLMFKQDESLETHIMVSLFEDAQLPAQLSIDMLPQNRGGSWINQINNKDGSDRGSLLWYAIINRPATNSNVAKAASFINESLEWLKKNNIVKEIITDKFKISGREISVQVILKQGATQNLNAEFSKLIKAYNQNGN